MEWQPIGTCPKDGDFLVSFAHGDIHPASRVKGYWFAWSGDPIYGYKQLTHWMPFPEPPHDPE